MKKLNILYYHWGEITMTDCVEEMRRLGHKVTIISKEVNDFDFDEEFVAFLIVNIKKDNYDCVFSFNYYPIISWFCEEYGVKYISWVYDSPHLTLTSISINNKCNEIYIFDAGLVDKLKKAGATRVHYLPLPFNRHRYDRLPARKKYKYDVTFLGTLYDDENNYYNQIKYLPNEMKNYLDDMIKKQQQDFTTDMFTTGISHEMCEQLSKYIQFDLGPFYRGYRDDVLRNVFRKKVTVDERYGLLKQLSEQQRVTLFSGKKPKGINVEYKGFADYYKEMPQIFRDSKVNLNITVRYNISGLPLRVIDVLGTGGFLLSSYQNEFDEYFVEGKSIAYFKTPDELIEKTNYYLEHDSEREQIALEGNRIAQQEFDYSVLLPKMFGTFSN